MKLITKSIIMAVVLGLSQLVMGQSLADYLTRAANFNKAGDLMQAAKVMEEAVQKLPGDAIAYSYLGFYRGMQAGQTTNYMEAGSLISSAFEMLNKAVAMDANNPEVRFNRGLMGIKVPSFMNQLDSGIEDLEYIIKMYQTAPDKIPVSLIINTYNLLGEGYLKRKETQNARASWEKVVELAPGTPLAEVATQNLEKTKDQPVIAKPVEPEKVSSSEVEKIKEALKKSPNNPDLYLQLGQAYIIVCNYEEAVKVLKKCIELDSANVNAYKLLIQATNEVVSVGYDARIYDDTNFRTNQAFAMVNLADKAVQIAPNDMELLLNRGRAGIMMPFFVGRLDQAIKDLEKVSTSSASNEIKAEAIYWLGYAYQKKATTNWIDVIKNYSETDASKLAFESMIPPIKHFNSEEYKKPFLAIDFVMGFRDELAPQTVVWVEDKVGNFVKTVYVSGFSAFAKEKQVNLPRWTKSSSFKDVDGVTGASIDLGDHIYVWDLKNFAGKSVKTGDYIVKVEVSFWPSMEYQSVAAPITIGKKDARTVITEGKLIPYLEVKYFAE